MLALPQTTYSLAAIRHNLALMSIEDFWWIMFVKVTNIKGKLTGHMLNAD